MKKICVFLMCLFFNTAVQAQLKIDITGGYHEPMPIAIAPFSGEGRAQDIRQIIEDNLQGTGLFRIIDENAYTQKLTDVRLSPDFPAWQVINAQALLFANVENTEDNKLKISFRLWDVYGQYPMLGRVLTLSSNEWRRLGHIVSDLVYSQITGESGYFDTRLVYVAQSGSPSKPQKRLAVMDQDGANQHYLTDGKSLVLTPRFAPNMQKIAYMSYKGGKPRVMIMDLRTMEETDLGLFTGMSFAPRFSNDGNKMLFSLSKNGNSEIYVYDLQTAIQTQLTKHPAIDTSACVSPDDSKIVFNSDRSGSQQLYVMDSDGKNVKRISFSGKGSYATPVWSPRGDYIAFTKIQGGEFFIGLMRPDGSAERLIAQGYLTEGPTFAPNGRVLAFYKQNLDENTGIYTIDITGHNERYIKTPALASDPAWSPLLFEKK